MEKYLLFLLTVLAVCSLKVTDVMVSKDTDKTKITTEYRLAKSRKNTTNIDCNAQKQLKKMKKQFQTEPDVLGMTKKELAGASLGNAFTIFLFDKNGKLLSDHGLVYPVFFKGKIIAILEMDYDRDTFAYTYTFGKAYADKLGQILCEGNIDSQKGLIVGRIANKFFITDGVHVEIILDQSANLLSEPDTISQEELEVLCRKLPQVVRANYISISKSAR